ncbi:DUF3795 domain-containing protein [Candidatus Fermentibacteria bacterium]|nr:DUF3795 domain-containing protein [Candidatus Fermentibacteria bacterium]
MRPDAYCGLYCGACEVMAANRRGTVADVAREWGRSEEELRCDGCKTDVLAVYCRDCTFRACAREKGVEFCSECGDYPCKALLAFRDDKAPHHSIVVHNLERIAVIGGRAWCEEQRARWSCPACVEPFSWYAEKCPSCGGPVKNAVQDEKELRLWGE